MIFTTNLIVEICGWRVPGKASAGCYKLTRAGGWGVSAAAMQKSIFVDGKGGILDLLSCRRSMGEGRDEDTSYLSQMVAASPADSPCTLVELTPSTPLNPPSSRRARKNGTKSRSRGTGFWFFPILTSTYSH